MSSLFITSCINLQVYLLQQEYYRNIAVFEYFIAHHSHCRVVVNVSFFGIFLNLSTHVRSGSHMTADVSSVFTGFSHGSY